MISSAALAERFEREARGLDQELAVRVAAALWTRVALPDRRKIRDTRLRAAAEQLGGSVEWKAVRLADLVGRALSGRPLPRVPEAPAVAGAVAVLPRPLAPRQVRRILTSRPRGVRGNGAPLEARSLTP